MNKNSKTKHFLIIFFSILLVGIVFSRLIDITMNQKTKNNTSVNLAPAAVISPVEGKTLVSSDENIIRNNLKEIRQDISDESQFISPPNLEFGLGINP